MTVSRNTENVYNVTMNHDLNNEITKQKLCYGKLPLREIKETQGDQFIIILFH